MPAHSGRLEQEHIPARVPLWREIFGGIDWLALHYSPVFYGLGVPHGDGSAVIVVPGFLADDLYLVELFCWLRRMGYKPYMSNIGRVINCLDMLVDRLQVTIQKAYDQTGRRVHLIGHSMGGMLARSAAEQRPDRVASVITLGSPFRGISGHPVVLAAGNVVKDRISARQDRPNGCFSGQCNCNAIAALDKALRNSPVMHTAIYTKKDGVVDWHYCINDDPSTNFEVPGTHIGLAFNPFVYRILSKRLHHAIQLEKPQAGKAQKIA